MSDTEKQKKILVVEDDPEIAQVVKMNLRDHGFEVEHTAIAREAIPKFKREGFDLLVLDLSLPDGDGLDICRSLREKNDHSPILMLTARTSEADRVLGLELGADDYLTKPFSVRELVARVKALLRRTGYQEASQDEEAGEPVHRFGLFLDPVKRKVSLNGNPITLTATEFDLLLHLARNPGRVYTRSHLLQAVWGYGHEGYEHTVNSHINRLRSKIEEDPAKPKYVRTVWGVGYKFPDAQDWGQ